MKNPWVAAVLSFLFFGAGSLYVGRRQTAPWALVTFGGTVVQVLEIKESPPFDNWPLWPWFFAGLVLLKVGLALDGYRHAQSPDTAP